ncbi:hypothetical protein DV515_00007966, partial [Chloebia gouldiae]
IPRHSKQNAHPADSPAQESTQEFKTEEGGLPASCLTANGDVSNGTESTLLQTAPDSADAQRHYISTQDFCILCPPTSK